MALPVSPLYKGEGNMTGKWKKKLLVLTALLILVVAAAAAIEWHFLIADWLFGDYHSQLWQTDQTPIQEVVPQNPLSDDPVKIEVDTPRLYGVRIGQPVAVRFIITTKTSNKVNFETISVGVLRRDQTPWKMLGTPQISVSTSGEDTTYTVDVVVACYEPPAINSDPASPSVGQGLWPFSVEFLFANKIQANGQPIWQYVQTPAIVFGFSSSVEPGASLLAVGSLDDAPAHVLYSGVIIMSVAFGLLLAGVSYWLIVAVRYIGRRIQPEPLPESASQFWQAMADADALRLRRGYVSEVHVAFRQYLGDATIPSDELAARWSDHPRHDEIVNTLAILDRAFYMHGEITEFEWHKALTFMRDFVPSRGESSLHWPWQSRSRG
jgi:hypothetical protein